jgi:hypothetical protein
MRGSTKTAVRASLIAFLCFEVSAEAQNGSEFIGSAACSSCHSKVSDSWNAGRHSRMLQPATASSVAGDFSRGRITLHGAAFSVRGSAGNFFITESALTGKRQEFHVDFTLGSRRIQHYLTRMPDGRIVLLAPSWDVTRREWFHNMDIVNPEESDGSAVQVWNKNCYSCHVSREDKGFDPDRNTYNTRWQDFGTNCERCHGPGGKHAQERRAGGATGTTMVVPTKLDPLRSTMICAQCHSLRDVVADGYTAGANYFDYFLPLLEYSQKTGSDPAYWADGRPRRFSNDALGFWQSECYLRGGATCANCHANLHDPRIEKDAAVQSGANSLCASCHGQIVNNTAAHSHHAQGSKGSSCVACHMPRTVFSIKAAIRDHTISIPSPENTAHYSIPNACGNCHADHDAKWALSAIDKWFGSASKARMKLQVRAAAFTQARQGDRSAVSELLAILSDSSAGQLTRANAVGYLGRFPEDPAVLTALEHVLKDADPLVRAVGALRLDSKSAPARTRNALIEALGDPIRSVRASAVLSLVSLGVPKLSGANLKNFDLARQDYLNRAALYSDDAGEQFTQGGFLLLTGDAAGAETALRSSLRLDAASPASYLLAVACMQLGQRDEALHILRGIRKGDRNFAAAQNLISEINAVKTN